jgi:hypothetical protein
MSLKNAAQYLAAHGRGADTTLMHVAPDEVARLQRAAQERGGSLTINPHTGLPEADFFSDLNPVHILKGEGAIGETGLGPALLAIGLNAIAPGAGGVAGMMGLEGVMSNAAATGLAVGGAGALATGSLQKGLMAGIGAYGATGLGEAAMGGINAEDMARKLAIDAGEPISQTAPMSIADKIKAGASGIGSLGKKDLLMKGLAAAGPLAAAQANKKMDVPTSAGGEGYIRQYYYDPKTHSVKPLEPVAAKDWGNTTFESRVPYLPESQAANGGLQAAYANGGIARFDEGGPADDAALSAYQAGDYAGANKALQDTGMTAQGVVDKYGLNAAQAAEVAKNLGYENADLSGLRYGGADSYEPSSLDDNGRVTSGLGDAWTIAKLAYPGLSLVDVADDLVGGRFDLSTIGNMFSGFGFADGGAVKRFDEGGATGYSASDINNYIAQNNLDAAGIAAAQQQFGVSDAQLAAARGGSGGDSGISTAAPAYTNYSTDQMASYFANPANANVSVNDAIKQFNADPNAVNQYIAGLSSGYVDPTNTQRGSGYVNQYQNMIKQGIDPTEFAAAASGVNKDFGKTGYWNQGTVAHAYDVADKILKFDPQTDKVTPSDKQWVNFMDTNKISVDDISRATGLTKAEVQARYDAAKEKAVVVVPPTVITPGGVSTTGGGRTTDTYTGGVTTTPTTYAPPGTTNPYGNYINPGDITINPDKSRTVTPNIPGRPYGGFTGIGQVRDAYTAGGGNLGQVLTPSKTYQNTGMSADIYKYLSGQGAYPIQETGIGKNSRYYYSEPSSANPANKYWRNPKTNALEINPGYVDPAAAAATAKTAATDAANGGLMAAMARGGSAHQPFFSRSTGKFNQAGAKVYADGGISVGSRYDPRIDGNPQDDQNTPFQTTVGKFASGGISGNGNLDLHIPLDFGGGGGFGGGGANGYSAVGSGGGSDGSQTGFTGQNNTGNSGMGGITQLPAQVMPRPMGYSSTPGMQMAGRKGPAIPFGQVMSQLGMPEGLDDTMTPWMLAQNKANQERSAASRANSAANPASMSDLARQLGIGMANGGITGYAAGGNTGYNLGGYSDGGRLLRGPGDGVSDSIPATIGHKQPARLADGEFVVPARIVSELGNGSTEAGARKLYAMMERVQQARGKTVGKGKVAKNSRADKYLPV